MSATSAHALVELLAHETLTRHGCVPTELAGKDIEPGHYLITADEYLLRTDTGLGFHYRQGMGVTIDVPADPPAGELELWLKGSVHAAIAAINGLLPIHASAVVCNGRVFAIGGASGAGKSTLAAGLSASGLPLFCDDTLLLDQTDPAGIWCLPGHKRLKLTSAALALTGAASQEKVGAMIDKFYAEPPGGAVTEPLPLGALLFVEDGDDFAVTAISGGDRIARLNDDHYTADFYAAAQRLTVSARFAQITTIARQIPMYRLTRPRDAASFPGVIAKTGEWLNGYRP